MAPQQPPPPRWFGSASSQAGAPGDLHHALHREPAPEAVGVALPATPVQACGEHHAFFTAGESAIPGLVCSACRTALSGVHRRCADCGVVVCFSCVQNAGGEADGWSDAIADAADASESTEETLPDDRTSPEVELDNADILSFSQTRAAELLAHPERAAAAWEGVDELD